MFKNKEDHDKSKKEIQYTMEIGGMGGCKLELLFEVKPKTDGSVEMHLQTFINMGWNSEVENQLRSQMKVDTSPTDRVIFSVPERLMQKGAHNIDTGNYVDENGEEEMRVITQWSKTFICGNNKDEVLTPTFHVNLGGKNANDVVKVVVTPKGE